MSRNRRAAGPLLWIALPACLAVAAGVLALTVQSQSPSARPTDDDPIERAYRRLDEVREARRQQLTAYLGRLSAAAEGIADDDVMRRSFALRLQMARLAEPGRAPADLARAKASLSDSIRDYVISRYGSFRDVWFVDANGEIFHSVRDGQLIGQNLIEGPGGQTSLGRRLDGQADQSFVDYERSALTGEATAFYVIPAKVGGEPAGWFVLACSIDKINSIFVRDASLGRTGEVFLVNEDCIMLTESRFRRDSSILHQHLSPANIHAKFADGSGRKVVTDYRRCRALTSFRVCRIMGTRWLLIAKIDLAEVLTDHYRRNRQRLAEPLARRLARGGPVLAGGPEPPAGAKVVDIDAFDKAYPGDALLTYGVRTCTAVVVYLPGEFAYMGHASNYDTMYGPGNLDVIGQIMTRVRRYDVYPYQMRQLRAVVVAPHTESLAGAVDKLVDHGLFLSQIRFLRQGDARNAQVFHDVGEGKTHIQWRYDGPGRNRTDQRPASVPTAGAVLEQLLLEPGELEEIPPPQDDRGDDGD